MNKQVILLQFCLSLVMPCLAFADNTYNWEAHRTYIGLDYGTAEYRDHNAEFSVNNVSGQAGEDKNSRQTRLTLGYNFTHFFALEGQYADLGEIKVFGNKGDSFTRSGVVTTFSAANSQVVDHYTAVALNSIFKLRFASSALYANAGAFYVWDRYHTYSAGVMTDSGVRYIGPYALQGAGYEYYFSPRVTARIEYDQMDLAVRKVVLISGGIMINF